MRSFSGCGREPWVPLICVGDLRQLLWVPLRSKGGLEGVPDLPGAPQDEAGLTRKFETSHVGGAFITTWGTTPKGPAVHRLLG